jgi:hypothetical protein
MRLLALDARTRIKASNSMCTDLGLRSPLDSNSRYPGCVTLVLNGTMCEQQPLASQYIIIDRPEGGVLWGMRPDMRVGFLVFSIQQELTYS